jgi:protocatechuate 3,4-dioxygenase beta subunit
MKDQKLMIVLIMGLVLSTGFFAVQYISLSTQTIQPPEICQSTFPDGDGPYYYPNTPYRKKFVPNKNNGEKLIVSGRLFKSDCKTVIPNATLDIWQADENGNYQKDWYRGKIKTDAQGKYRFETVMPKGYGKGTGYRPAHIHFKIEINNQVLVTSEMFFPVVKGQAGFDDAYIMKLEKKNEWGKTVTYGYHDIILP